MAACILIQTLSHRHEENVHLVIERSGIIHQVTKTDVSVIAALQSGNLAESPIEFVSKFLWRQPGLRSEYSKQLDKLSFREPLLELIGERRILGKTANHLGDAAVPPFLS